MKAHRNWSYAPYRPPFIDVGDPYICRVAPQENGVTFDWLPNGSDLYTVYFRRRDSEIFEKLGTTADTTYTVSDLETLTDYEFYVETEKGKSRVRLARTGAVFGSVVNYLHPDDEAYSFSGRSLCSPSFVRHPDGYLLASMDVFAGNYPQNLTLIFRSDDDGKNWSYVSELFPCFWGKLFVYENEIYMLSVSTEYGDLLIGKSCDGGKTFCEPSVLLRGANGKNGSAGVHKNPEPVVEYNGRIWNTLEWGSWGRGYHAPMVMSAPVGCDLLDPDNWLYSEPVKYDPTWPGVAHGPSSGNIEGTLVVKDGVLYNIMRYDMTKTEEKYGRVIRYRVNTEDPEAPLTYDACTPFPGNHSKFMIKYHEGMKRYYSICSWIYDGKLSGARNLLSLVSSEDLVHWEKVCDLLDYRHEDLKMVGFQYVDFEIEGDEILYMIRVSMNGARNFHDANYSIFDRYLLMK